jgi:preprotein translocase subunit YajC
MFLPAFLLQAAGGGSMLGLLLPVAMFAVMYFLIILPQQRQRKKTQEMLASLKNGDEVVTNGGIVGTIFSLNPEDDTIVLRIKPDNVKLRFARQSVAARVQTEGAPAA